MSTAAHENESRPRVDTARPTERSRGELSTVWLLWLTYGAFYFCRTNLSAAVPGMKSSLESGGLGLTVEQTGWILASLKIAYGLGQLLNGQLAEKFSPRILLAVGMFASAFLNVLFGFSTGFYFLLFIWATNGFCQSLGWPSTVRVVGNWIPIATRGKAIGIIGTGYQVTLGLTYFVAGQSAEYLGWRAALYVPAAILALSGIVMLFFLREAPPKSSESSDPHIDKSNLFRDREKTNWIENILLTLSNPALWLFGLSLGFLNACRYGFLDWGVSHLISVQKIGVGKAGLNYVVLAMGAVAGSYLAGWGTDKFFQSRRPPMICILLVILSLMTLVYDWMARTSAMGTVLLLVAIGFCIYGPQVLLVGTAPADFAKRGTAAAAAGFVNFLGYMGASCGDVLTAKAIAYGGWQYAIYWWSAWAIAAAILSGILWTQTGRPRESMSQCK